MEKALLEVVITGKTCFKPLIGRMDSIKSSQWKGFPVKACYSAARTPSKEIESPVAPTKFPRSDSSCVVNGSNGASFIWGSSVNSYILDAYEDQYGGIVINPDRLPRDASAFANALQASLSLWNLLGKKGVWLKLRWIDLSSSPCDLKSGSCDLVKLLLTHHFTSIGNFPRIFSGSVILGASFQEGFKYHHAEQTYVMLTYWIPQGPCMLPANASHQVGVGGFVINDHNEVLVVQEKYWCSAFSSVWKLPTGFILESEEIFTGAVREVKEETGIDTEFEEIIAFRHAHHVDFGKSDLFFICMLRPLSTEIKIDDAEIQAAKWMPLVEFVEQPFNQEDNMFKKIID
ncbi:Nudix hydrolase 8, partial [Ananas comosus]